VQLTNSAERYGAVPQIFHWLTAAFVAAAWLLGQFGEVFPRGDPRIIAMMVHMNLGLAVLVILLPRFLFRVATPQPKPEPHVLGVWGDRLSAATHYVLYALLLAAPVAGIALQFARGRGLPVFGLFEIASPWTADRAFSRSVREMHELFANAILIIAGLHAAAALVHHYLFGDRTLRRMLPARERSHAVSRATS
jgi:cytochrome b561